MKIDARELSFANRGWQVWDRTTDKLMTDVVWVNNITAQYGEYFRDSKGFIFIRQASRIVISAVGRVVFINAPADKSETQLMEFYNGS